MAETKIVFIGRLEEDTGILKFLKWMDKNPKNSVDFIGDGVYRVDCEKYGKVHGFTNPKPYLKKADIAIPGGYLSYIQAKHFGCKIIVFPSNPLKKDYWEEIQKIDKFSSWNQIANEYINLYNNA